MISRTERASSSAAPQCDGSASGTVGRSAGSLPALSAASCGRIPRRASSKEPSCTEEGPALLGVLTRGGPEPEPEVAVRDQEVQGASHSSGVDASSPVSLSLTMLVSCPTGEATTGAPLAMYWMALRPHLCRCCKPSSTGARPMSIGARSDCSPSADHFTSSCGTPDSRAGSEQRCAAWSRACGRSRPVRAPAARGWGGSHRSRPSPEEGDRCAPPDRGLAIPPARCSWHVPPRAVGVVLSQVGVAENEPVDKLAERPLLLDVVLAPRPWVDRRRQGSPCRQTDATPRPRKASRCSRRGRRSDG